MHKKFKVKIKLDELLNEVESAAEQIEYLHKSAMLINNYCKNNKNVHEINNLLHLTKTFEIELLYLSQELKHIVKKEKYHEPDFSININKNIDLNDVIFEDD